MSVDRTDYLMWGAKIDPDAVDIDRFEAEMNGEEGRRFDLVYDGMSGEYAVAGKIIAKSDAYEGLSFKKIDENEVRFDVGVAVAVKSEFSDVDDFALYLFSHFH